MCKNHAKTYIHMFQRTLHLYTGESQESPLVISILDIFGSVWRLYQSQQLHLKPKKAEEPAPPATSWSVAFQSKKNPKPMQVVTGGVEPGLLTHGLLGVGLLSLPDVKKELTLIGNSPLSSAVQYFKTTAD